MQCCHDLEVHINQYNNNDSKRTKSITTYRVRNIDIPKELIDSTYPKPQLQRSQSNLGGHSNPTLLNSKIRLLSSCQ